MALNSQSFSVPFHLTSAVESALEAWRSGDKLARLWQRDASLWTDADEADWLGWIDAPEQSDPSRYEAILSESRAGAFSDILLLGMGGSVLCPALFGELFGQQPAFPRLTVLDSLDPASIREVERSLDLEHTLVIVSSKSGSTLESRVLMAYFLERVGEAVGVEKRGRQFVAITDPGSTLEQSALSLDFRHVFSGSPDIGGRFSAFSTFGLVPLALMGVDVERFVAKTMPMVEACGPRSGALASPGVLLGVILGVLAAHGRDKVTLIASPSLVGFSDWLEQLLAESTGKNGVGLIPVTREEPGPPDEYGDDRVFVYLKQEQETDDTCETGVASLEESGQPVVRIGIREPLSIGQELFRWEIATAVAGAELGVHPFNQPDVEASKRVTRDLMSEYERTGRLADESPTVEDQSLKIFRPGGADPQQTGGEVGNGGAGNSIRTFLGSLRERDYCAILAYAPRSDMSVAALERLKAEVRRTSNVATTVSFGPRYLHSSGQLHKGGPNTGVFLILVSDDTDDLSVPGHPYSFGVVKAAQARGDALALAKGGRRVLRVEIAGSFDAGVDRIASAVAETGA